MTLWLRIALIAVLAVVLWMLVIDLTESVDDASRAPAGPPAEAPAPGAAPPAGSP